MRKKVIYSKNTLIISMSTEIHQILVKKLNEADEVLLTIDVWSSR